MANERKRAPFIDDLWPRLAIESGDDQAMAKERADDLDRRIVDLTSLPADEAQIFLDAVREVQEYEDGRRASAESRAATIIATVATIFTFMTWALANADKEKICGNTFGCGIWSLVFTAAVAYFIAAAVSGVRVLTVGVYQVIGVEDLVRYRERGLDITKALIRDTLLAAHRNRGVINTKIDHIKLAQRRFLLGLFVMGGLLIWDPFMRLGVVKGVTDLMFNAPISAPKKTAP